MKYEKTDLLGYRPWAPYWFRDPVSKLLWPIYNFLFWKYSAICKWVRRDVLGHEGINYKRVNKRLNKRGLSWWQKFKRGWIYQPIYYFDSRDHIPYEDTRTDEEKQEAYERMKNSPKFNPPPIDSETIQRILNQSRWPHAARRKREARNA